jgi:hypothetical protein
MHFKALNKGHKCYKSYFSTKPQVIPKLLIGKGRQFIRVHKYKCYLRCYTTIHLGLDLRAIDLSITSSFSFLYIAMLVYIEPNYWVQARDQSTLDLD